MSAPLTLAVRRALVRIPLVLTEDGFATDQDLVGELRIDYADVRTAVGILYRLVIVSSNDVQEYDFCEKVMNITEYKWPIAGSRSANSDPYTSNQTAG